MPFATRLPYLVSDVNPTLVMLVFCAFMLASVIGCAELGRLLRQRERARHPERLGEGISALEGAQFALLGLLIAFTFSGATERFDHRRRLIIEESTALETAWLRFDLLPAPDRAAMQDGLRRYLDARLRAYRSIPDEEAVTRHLKDAEHEKEALWHRGVSASQAAPTPMTGQVLLPALNEVFDVATTRTATAYIHPPFVLFVMLVVLALVCSVLAGYAMGAEKRRNWLHTWSFALMLTLTVYVILDLEYPRVGLIRVDTFDQVLVEMRESMR